MEDYRKLALEAAMKIPYQTHSELLTSADKIYQWLTKNPGQSQGPTEAERIELFMQR